MEVASKRRVTELEELCNTYGYTIYDLESDIIDLKNDIRKRARQERQKNERKKRRIAELEERCNRQRCTISDLENDIKERARHERQKNARKKRI